MTANEDILKAILPSRKAGGSAKSGRTASPSGSLAGFAAPGSAAGTLIPQQQDNSGGDWFSNILNTPVIKEVLNALGTGSYTVGNALNAGNDRLAKVNELQQKGASQDEIQKAYDDAHNPLNFLGDIISAPVKGVMGGIGQNKDYQVTPSRAINRMQGKQDTDQSNLIQNLALDVVADPLNFVSLGAPGAAVKGAVAGARDAKIAEQSARAAGEAGQIGERTGIVAGAIKGAKDEMAARRARIADEKSQRQYRRDLRNSGVPAQNIDETITGWKESTNPELIANLTQDAKVPEWAVRAPSSAETAPGSIAEQSIRDAAARGPQPNPSPEVGFSAFPKKFNDGNVGSLKENDLKDIAKMQKKIDDIANSADNPMDSIKAVNDSLGQAADESTAAATLNSIVRGTDSKTVLDGLTPPPRVRQPRSVAESVQSVRANGSKLPDSEVKVNPNQIRQLPPELKQADYSHFTAADRFVLGTEHLMGQVPKYSSAVQNRVAEFIKNHPNTEHTVLSPAEHDFTPLASKPVGDFVLHNNRKATPDQIKKFFAGNPTIEEVTAKFKSTPDLSKYETKAANVWHTGDVNSIDPEHLTALGLKPEDYAHALMGTPLSDLTKPTENLNKILDQMANGELMDPAAYDKFHEFMKSFTENPNISLPDAIDKAKEFAARNADAIKESVKTFKPTSVGGRLGTGKSPQIYIQKLLPSEIGNSFRKQLSVEESAKAIDDAGRAIDNAISQSSAPGSILRIADEAAKLGEESLAIRNASVSAGKADKWYITHSMQAVFDRVNSGVVSSISANFPKLKAGSPAFNRMRDEMSMLAMAKVDNSLKAKGIFPYLTGVMPKGSAAIRLSVYDVLDSMGPALRQKHIWTEKGNINEVSVAQMMDVAETVMRSVIGIGSKGEVSFAAIKPEVIKALKGQMTAKGVQYEIAAKIPHARLNSDVIEANLKTGRMNNPTKSREVMYSRLYNDITRINEDGSSVTQALAERLLRNTQLHNSVMTDKIIGHVQETKAAVETAFNSGSTAAAAKAVADVKPVHSTVEPDVAKLTTKLDGETVREFATPMEQIHADATNKIAQAIESGRAFSVGKDGEAVANSAFRAARKETPQEAKLKALNTEIQVRQAAIDAASGARKAELKRALNQRLASQGIKDFSRKPRPPWNQKLINQMNKDLAARTTNPNLHPDNMERLLENGGTDNLFDVTAKDLGWDVATRLRGFSRIWNVTFGKKMSYDTVTSGTHLVTALETAFREVLNDFAKTFRPDQIDRAYRMIADESKDVIGAVIRGEQGFDPEVVQLSKIMDHMFNPTANNFFGRNGVSAEHMNDILSKMEGVPKTWRFATGNSSEIANSYKFWKDVENPLKMMESMHMAMTKAAFDVSVASKYSHFFGMKTVPAGEVGRWMKIDPNTVGGNVFAKLIDQTLWYPKEVLDELPALSRMITDGRTPFRNMETLRKWTTEVFDPLVSGIKLTQTTVKPGHHVMSLQGDMLRNMLAGMGFSLKPYKDSWNVIRARHAGTKELSALDEYARVQKLTGSVKMTGEGKGINFMLGGRKTHVSYDDLYKGLEQRDIILPLHSTGIAEDLLTTDAHLNSVGKSGAIFNAAEKGAKGFNNVVTRLTNNRIVKVNKFTADRDNFGRVALALHYMQSKPFKTMDEALDYASKMIRKAAPTARDLTAAESKYARRLVFYYTWQRGILPRVVEWTLERPAVAMLPSKVMYDIAESNGLNPQSYGDPFPPDTLMPDYYKNMVLGPQWQDPNTGEYWGLNPTSPLLDTMNSLGSGITLGGFTNPGNLADSSYARIGKTLLGMTNPLLKAPIELSQGSTLGTGTPIVDAGQYFMDIPGPTRLASQVTGKTFSPQADASGNFTLTPNRTETKYRGGFGSQEEWVRNLIPIGANWITGAQIKDYTAPGAVKNAEFQKKDKATAEKRQSQRVTGE